MDELGIQLEHKSEKIIAKKGQSICIQNREIITVIAAINVAGKAAPPQFIAYVKTLQSIRSFHTEHASKQNTWSVSDSGWTKQGITRLWFKSFVKKHWNRASTNFYIRWA